MQFHPTFIGIQCSAGLLLSPSLIELCQMRFTGYKAHGAIDSALLGDVLAESWNLYTFGAFDLTSFLASVRFTLPTNLAARYEDCGLTASEDQFGFHQMFCIPGSHGKEIRVSNADGSWTFSRDMLMTPTTVSHTAEYGRMWPIVTSTSTSLF